MNVKHFRWPFLVITMAWFYWANELTFTIGITQSCVDGVCHFEGGTEPHAIAAAVGLILLYVLFLYAPPARLGAPMPRVFRRLLAFLLDFIFFMGATVPLVGIAPTLMEWRGTGVFQWNFARDASAPYDGWLAMILALSTFICMAFYFALPLILGRPSPGSCMMGYQIIPDEGGHLTLILALKRAFYGFIAVCSAYAVPFKRREKENGKFWLDIKFGTHAVKLN